MSDLPGFKKFVTEDEVEEQKRKRQEEWEKVRKPEDPVEAPEEVHDPRSLFEKLQEQKDKKQQEFEDSIKLKNQVKGLESDEVEFLNFVSDKQVEIEKAREKENETMLAEYRNAVSNQVTDKTKSPVDKKIAKAGPSGSQKKSQSSLLAGAVKRKGSEAADGQEAKKNKTTDIPDSSSDEEGDSAPGGEGVPGMARVVGILPGMGAYSGTSSESDTSSSDDDDIDTRMFSKKHVVTISHKH